MPSPYSFAIPAFIQEVDIAFANAMRLTSPHRADDVIPGERYGLIDFETYARDATRPRLGSVRGGAEAKEIRASMLIELAFDGQGKTDEECRRMANVLFLQGCFDLEHELSNIKGQVNNHEFFYEMEISGPLDKAVSVALRDRQTWLVRLTGNIVVRLMVRREITGEHVLPLNNMESLNNA